MSGKVGWPASPGLPQSAGRARQSAFWRATGQKCCLAWLNFQRGGPLSKHAACHPRPPNVPCRPLLSPVVPWLLALLSIPAFLCVSLPRSTTLDDWPIGRPSSSSSSAFLSFSLLRWILPASCLFASAFPRKLEYPHQPARCSWLCRARSVQLVSAFHASYTCTIYSSNEKLKNLDHVHRSVYSNAFGESFQRWNGHGRWDRFLRSINGDTLSISLSFKKNGKTRVIGRTRFSDGIELVLEYTFLFAWNVYTHLYASIYVYTSAINVYFERIRKNETDTRSLTLAVLSRKPR